jgi:hypothetical protein
MSHEERWQLSGNAAEFYERYVRLLMEPWVRCLVDAAALEPAEQILDVACWPPNPGSTVAGRTRDDHGSWLYALNRPRLWQSILRGH